MTPRPSTFSIVARDPEQGAVGVAVQSKFVSVSSIVPSVSADAGAIATQNFANVTYGSDGLNLLREGHSAEEVASELTDADDEAPSRQVGVVRADGSIAAFTGNECFDVAGDIQGDHYTVQGNILENEATLDAMAEAFETTDGGLPEHLLAALYAGNDAGGGKRGEQSAAMYIVKPEGGYDGGNDRWVDVRVDDHDHPIAELERVFKLYDITLLERETPAETMSLPGETAEATLETLSVLGLYDGTPSGEFDDEAVKALESFRGMNNFENHSLAIPEGAIARGWDDVAGGETTDEDENGCEDGTTGADDATDELDGETKFIEAIWQDLSRLGRKQFKISLVGRSVFHLSKRTECGGVGGSPRHTDRTTQGKEVSPNRGGT